jgi:16S rRNA (uracil1498-N3)-methyltransferase
VKLDKKGPEAFVDRWQKIADQALKQCGRLYRLEVAAPRPLSALLAEKASRVWTDEGTKDHSPPLGAWLRESKPTALHLLIGPEGGWSGNERRQLNPLPAVSLGPLILRAETAALYAATIGIDHFRARNLDNNAQKK